MILNSKQDEKTKNNNTLNLTYSGIGKMALTHRRIESGFRQKIKTKFQDHTKTSTDNMLLYGLQNSMRKEKQQRAKNNNNKTVNIKSNTVLMGGNEITPQQKIRKPHEASLDLVKQFDRKNVLPFNRNVPPRRNYVNKDTLSLKHIFTSLSKQKPQYKQSSKGMRQLLQYRFVSHSCEFISPKITQSTHISIKH